MEAPAWKKIDPPLPPLPRRLEDHRTKSKFSWYLLVLALAIGIEARIFGPSWMRMLFQGANLESLAAAGAFAAAFAAAIVFHEAGHLIAAILLKFEVLGATLGPIRATRLHGRWSFQPSGAIFSGSVSAIPRDGQMWRKRMLLVVSAGPAATFLTGIASGLFLFSGQFDGWTRSLLALSTELNFFLFALGLIPNGAQARVRNDARLCYSLLRNIDEAQDILLYHLALQLSIAGVRPRDYPEPLIRKLAASRSRPDMSLMYAHIITSWAIDCGDIHTAGVWRNRALELSEFCDLRMQNLTLARSAFFDVLFEDDLAAARLKFAHVDMNALFPRSFTHRAKAAYQLATGNIGEALAEIHRARFSFPKHFPYYEFERGLLQQLHQKILEAEEQSRTAQLESSVASHELGLRQP